MAASRTAPDGRSGRSRTSTPSSRPTRSSSLSPDHALVRASSTTTRRSSCRHGCCATGCARHLEAGHAYGVAIVNHLQRRGRIDRAPARAGVRPRRRAARGRGTRSRGSRGAGVDLVLADVASTISRRQPRARSPRGARTRRRRRTCSASRTTTPASVRPRRRRRDRRRSRSRCATRSGTSRSRARRRALQRRRAHRAAATHAPYHWYVEVDAAPVGGRRLRAGHRHPGQHACRPSRRRERCARRRAP